MLCNINLKKVAAIPAVEQVLQEWDIKQTDILLKKLEADRNARQQREKKLREAENNRFVHNGVVTSS